MAEATELVNPRNLREKYAEWVGKRVSVGLTTFHYICGTWKEMSSDHAVFLIGEHSMKVKLSEVANIQEAPTWQADYFK